VRRYRHRADAKLTRAQVQAAYVIYRDQGLSVRAVAGLIWERYGYASQASCANSLHDLFKGENFLMRDKNALMAERNFKHGRCGDRAAYKRWHRAEFGPWPSDRKPSAVPLEAVSAPEGTGS
jgi:hypothetical protein